MSDHECHLPDCDLIMAADGELPPARQACAEAHLAGCVACRSRGDRLTRMADAATTPYRSQVLGAEGIASSRARLRSQLDDLAAAGPDRRRPWPGPLPAVQWAMIGAALLAAAVLLGVVPAQRADFPADVRGAESAALPLASLTPGATWNVGARELCAGGTREQRPVPAAIRQAVLRAYGMERVPPGDYELDYLITPELGGAPDARNLWPQPYASRAWNARVKDQLERLLPRLVCEGALSLETAQREIAVDWVAAYKKHFHTDVPLLNRASASAGDEEETDGAGDLTYPVWRAGITVLTHSGGRRGIPR